MLLLQLFCIVAWRLSLSVAQEPPAFSIPKFSEAPNQDFRTNVCARQEAVINGELELKDALRGLDLTVAITDYTDTGFDTLFGFSDTGTIKTQDPGLFVVLLDEIAKRAGFRWRNSYAAILPIHRDTDGNKTWTDLLRWETLHFDIAADYWGRSRERMALGISFPKGWYDGSIILAQSVPKLGTGDNVFATYFSFLQPFDVRVWLLIIASIVFTGMMYMALERMNTESDERELEDKPLTSIFIASLTFTGHFGFRPNTNAARLLSCSWTFWALIIMSAYTANMASFLVSRNDREVYVSTLSGALKSGAPICIQRYSVMDDIVSKKYPEMNIIRKDTEQELFEALRLPLFQGNSGCKALLTNLGTFQLFQGDESVNHDCSLTSEKRVVQNLPSGFATGVDTGTLCTSLVSYVMNIHLTEMFADNFIPEKWEEHVGRMSTVNCTQKLADANKNRPIDEDENFSLRLEEMGGIFIMHLGLTVVAILLAFVDLQKRLAMKRAQRGQSGENLDDVDGTQEKQPVKEMDRTENCTYLHDEPAAPPQFSN